MSKELYEKLGLFYLGKDVDKETMKRTEALTLLKSSYFTTHAAIIGMTGSGKTGLGVGIIEEAAIDNIPSIVIDPKGDMGNLCLTDATFAPENFMPWVSDEANAKGEDPQSYAQKTATEWKEGLGRWGQDSARVEKFAKIPKTIYTPGSSAGVSVNIMTSLEAPPAEIIEDSDTFASFLKSTVAGLLSLISIEADPINSKEYILLSQIISDGWVQGKTASIEELIAQIINPPFKKIGVLPLDSFYPQNDRFAFAGKFNAVIASPSFAIWLQGESLDIQKLLYDGEGKAKIAIFSISHLNDDERMFFVTLLLNKYIAWMRHQSGTSALKTLLYMDEIFGFFPPTKNPPSKEPMLLLLKQARAYGVGVILSTQNPVDLDYKGLSNIGTWFVGRLQTAQDIEKVIDGLGGKIGSSFENEEIKNFLSNLQKRTFFLKSVHLDDLSLFETRWVLSYLKGPLKKADISELMNSQKKQKQPKEISKEPLAQATDPAVDALGIYENFVTLDGSIPQYFVSGKNGVHRYLPTIVAKYIVGFFNQSKGINKEEKSVLTLSLNPSDTHLDWAKAVQSGIDFDSLATKPAEGAQYGAVPDFVSTDKGLKRTKEALEEMLYRDKNIEIYTAKAFKIESKPGDSLGDFKVRLQDTLREAKESEIGKLKDSYEKKEHMLSDRIERAKERVSKEESDVTSKTTDTVISAGIAVLGAFFGRSNTSRIGTALNKGSRILKEKGDVGRAQEAVDAVQKEMDDLSVELEEKIDEIEKNHDIDRCEIETLIIKPKKSDITVEHIALVWRAE